MAAREIIEIDEDKCDGCGQCAEGCHEGALRVIDGKARLVGESLCDGLGACIGECPRGAIKVTRREAEEYDEAKVMSGLAKLGPKVIAAHMEHLRSHGQDGYLREARAYLEAGGTPIPELEVQETGGCPGSASRRFSPLAAKSATASPAQDGPSELTHWPVQLHLINPRAQQFVGKDLLIAADCTAFAFGSFHARLLAGKSLVIACPKLDQGREIYVEKLATMLASAKSVTVAIMEVPCCSGLLKMVMDARVQAGAELPVRTVTIGIQGTIVEG
jgi:NAD-dependent dihydropyrimidine dehydrogenase PreA subunit